MAHYERFSRDLERLIDNRKRLKICPLGSGALAGTTYNIDREFTAKKLGFDKASCNSLDSVSDRDFVAENNFALSLFMVHMSQLSEEIIIWASQEWSFVELDPKMSTGSSMMPQKRNPDIPELIRGKTGRVIGSLVSILTVLKSLPLAYNKDLQEDKEELFDACETCSICLEIMNKLLNSLKFNLSKMSFLCEKSFMNATDVADFLVKNNMAFRDAYKITGQIVKYCLENNKILKELSVQEWQSFNNIFNNINIQELLEYISVKNSVNNRNSFGGTSPDQVYKQIQTNINNKNIII